MCMADDLDQGVLILVNGFKVACGKVALVGHGHWEGDLGVLGSSLLSLLPA